MKKYFLSLVFMLSIAYAEAQKSAVFVTKEGAIRGYDPVAFFKDGKPVPGAKDITHEWNGATWHFKNKENKAAFAANPEQFAPQYGGYCAYGTAEGYKAPTEIDTWTVVDKKLYFNYNKDVQAEWNKNRAALITKANEQWPKIKDKE